MADEHLFEGIGFAADVQTGFGSINTTIRDLASGGTFDEDDGFILGDKNAGDAESGITLPTLAGDFREVASVTGGFTEQADAYLKTLVEGFAIAFPLQGNGADAGSPTEDAAIPDLGIQAVWASLGMTGATGDAEPDYKFTPAAAGVTYSTIKVFVGDFSYVFQDCVVDSGSLVFTPGGNGIITANIKVGTVQDVSDGVTFPTVTYGQQSGIYAPTIEGVNFTLGEVRGFNTLTININNSIEEFGDSNVAETGLRQSQTRQLITVDGTLYIMDDSTDPDQEYTSMISAPTADLSFQVGDPDVGGAETELNAYLVNVNNLQTKSMKHNRIGTTTVVELNGAKATDAAVGGEFMFEYN